MDRSTHLREGLSVACLDELDIGPGLELRELDVRAFGSEQFLGLNDRVLGVGDALAQPALPDIALLAVEGNDAGREARGRFVCHNIHPLPPRDRDHRVVRSKIDPKNGASWRGLPLSKNPCK